LIDRLAKTAAGVQPRRHPNRSTYPSSPEDTLHPYASYLRPAPNFSWIHPKLEARHPVDDSDDDSGSGMFATEPIKAGEHLVVWTGRIVTADQALASGIMDTDEKAYLLQVGVGFYQVPLSEEREPADWTNHSCEPNAGFGKGSPICLSAMRDIAVGEEICFDYAMCETDERLFEPMKCLCGTASCRGWITAHDWKLPALWESYKGFWSPHVQREVDALSSLSTKEGDSECKSDTDIAVGSTDASNVTKSIKNESAAMCSSLAKPADSTVFTSGGRV